MEEKFTNDTTIPASIKQYIGDLYAKNTKLFNELNELKADLLANLEKLKTDKWPSEPSKKTSTKNDSIPEEKAADK